MQERGRPVSQTARMRFDYRLRGYRLLAARMPEIQAHARLKPPQSASISIASPQMQSGAPAALFTQRLGAEMLSMDTPPRVT